MRNSELNQGETDLDALWRAFQDLEAGEMPPAACDELMERVRESPFVRDAYLEYFELSAMVAGEATTHFEQASLPEDLEDARTKHRWRPWFVSWAAAAALVVGLLMLFRSGPTQGDRARETFSARPVPGILWKVNGDPVDGKPGVVQIKEGSAIEVVSGTLKLIHASGAEMVIRGPAKVEFPAFARPVVESGWLWLDTRQSDLEFEITTPDLVLKDIGTQFGTFVPEDGPAEVHLIKGRVDALSKATKRRLISLLPENQGVAIPDEAEPIGVKLAHDPFDSFEGLAASEADYRTVVMGQSPVGFWSLDTSDQGMVMNTVTDELDGGLHPAVTLGEKGPSPAEGFTGFPSPNRALQLTGQQVWAPLSLGTNLIHHDILFREDFEGTRELHKARPAKTLNGARWTASRAFGGDGRLRSERTGTATLPFVPVDGQVYTLDASFRGIQSGPGVDTWVGLGFASGQSVSGMLRGPGENRFLEGSTTGRAWLLFRAGGITAPHEACLGTTGLNGGIADSSPWENWRNENGGDVDLRMVLDTRKGAGHWIATWFAKRPGSPEYTRVRPSTRLLNEKIRSLGIALGRPGLSGRVTAFSLRTDRQDEVPRRNGWLANQPASLSRKAGAVSFWIKPLAGRERTQAIWSAGSSPRDRALQCRLSKTGQVSLFIDHERYRILATSEQVIESGKWHHVTANWGPSQVELYLNGKIAAQDSEFQPLPDDELREFYFGSGPLGGRDVPLHAALDEVAVWSRPLNQAEVMRQFEASQHQTINR